MTNYGYEHKYCPSLGPDARCDQDKNEDNICPRTYEEFIMAIKDFMYSEADLDSIGNCTYREKADYYKDVADTIDDLKKTMQNIIKQRIADGLDVTLGEKALQDISRI